MTTASGQGYLVLVHAKRMLGLVHNAFAGTTVNVVILGASHLVTKRLARRLVAVWLGLTCNLVTRAGERLLGLVKSGLGRVGLLCGLMVSRRSRYGRCSKALKN